jgi:hypothetical protein
MNGRFDGRKNKLFSKTYNFLDRYRRTDGWTDGRTDGQTDRRTFFLPFFLSFLVAFFLFFFQLLRGYDLTLPKQAYQAIFELMSFLSNIRTKVGFELTSILTIVGSKKHLSNKRRSNKRRAAI